jgi:hypothetical protein
MATRTPSSRSLEIPSSLVSPERASRCSKNALSVSSTCNIVGFTP